MIDDFIDEMEETYGKYKSGMKKAITDNLSDIDRDGEKKLMRIVVENYDMGRPPNLKILLELMYKNKINIKTHGYGGMSVCEFCNFEYDQDLIECPKCHKERKFGITRLYKMGEGKMHPFEIQRRKEEREAMEPPPEEIRKFNEYLSQTGGLTGLLMGKIKNLRKVVK